MPAVRPQKLILRVVFVNVAEKLFVLNAVAGDKFDSGLDCLVNGLLDLHLQLYGIDNVCLL